MFKKGKKSTGSALRGVGRGGAVGGDQGAQGQQLTKLKDRLRKVEAALGCLTATTVPQVVIPRNPSPFGVFAAVRLTCLSNRQRRATVLQLETAAAWKEAEEFGTIDLIDTSSSDEASSSKAALPKIVGIGLQGVFEIIKESRQAYPSVCKRALASLLNILQGLQPEELAQEPASIMDPTFETLLELASSESGAFGTNEECSEIRSLASACLLSFAVAYGDSGKMLMAISTMLMCPPRVSEKLVMPSILVSLQRSVISVMLGKTEHPDYMTQGVRTDSLFDAFPVNFGRQSDAPKVFSQAADGAYLYLQTDQGLYKIGTSYAGTIKGKVYRHNPNFCTDPGWLGHVNGTLYFRSHLTSYEDGGAASWSEKFSLVTVSPEDLEVVGTVTSRDQSVFGNAPFVLFDDGVNIGVVTVNNSDNFVIKFLDPQSTIPMTCVSGLPLKLARKCVDVYGSSIFDLDGSNKKHQVEVGCDDEIVSLQAGKDFALLLNSQGKVSYSGKKTFLRTSR